MSAEQAQRLSRYMPKHLITKILESRLEMVGERKQATFLFADVVGSTAIGEAFNEEVFRSIMDGALRRMIDEVHRYEGTVGQLRGDEVFALFGVPLVHEDDPERAVRTALGIRRSVSEYARVLARTHDITDFDVRVTLNTGDVIVGEIGSDLHAEYTAMGDAVNTAAKLQGVAKPGTIVVTHETYDLVAHLTVGCSLGEVALKGKREPVEIFEINGLLETPERLRSLEGLRSPLIGRSRELQELQRCYANLESGIGQVVLVVGQAGIGKTRLVSELHTRTPTETATWMSGRCLSYGHALSYHPFVAAIRDWLGIHEEDSLAVAVEKLRRGLQDLFSEDRESGRREIHMAALLGLELEAIDEPTVRAPEEVRRGIERALQELLLRLAERRPLILCFEDLHWADRASLDLLKLVMEATDTAPILLLCVSRPDHESPIWELKAKSEGTAEIHLSWIELLPLSDGESADLLSSLLRAQSLPEELGHAVVERAEGNPLFIEEFLRSMIAKGSIERHGDQWIVRKPTQGASLPRLLVGIIADRIDALGERPREILRAASVLGRDFGHQVLNAILASAGFDQVEVPLEQLLEAELVTERRGGKHVEYSFKHDLIREVAYESMLAATRADWHRRAASALESLLAERAEENAAVLAHHYRRASEWPAATRNYLSAAGRARAIYANAEAIDLYTAALEVTEHLAGEESAKARFAALSGRAAVLGHTGRTDDEARDLEELRVVAITQSDAERAEVALLFSDHACRTGQFDEALRETEEARALCEHLNDEHGCGRVLEALGTVLSHTGDLEGARDRFCAALDIFSKLGDKRMEARARKGLGTAHARLGAFEEAAAEYTVAAEIYRDRGDRGGESDMLGNLGALQYLQDDYESAAATLIQACELFREMGNIRNEAKCLNNLVLCSVALADYAEARKLHEKAIRLYTKIGDEASTANALSNLGIAQEALAVDGDPAFRLEPIAPTPLLDNAAESHRSALAIYEACGDQVGSTRSLYNLGCVAISRGDTQEALRLLKRALDGARELGLETLAARSLAAMSRALLQRGSPAEALERSTAAIRSLGETHATGSDEVHFAHHATLAACGRNGDAAQELDLAIKSTTERAARIRNPLVRERYLAAYRSLFEARDALPD